LLSLDKVTVRFGGHTLIDNAQAMINPNDRIGLVGPNGAGKSTLLRIIAGWSEPDEGNIAKPDRVEVGYLPQDGVEPDTEETLFQEVKHTFDDLLELQDEVKQIQHKLSSLEEGTEQYQKTLKKYGNLQHQLEESGVYSIRARIESVLVGLGFEHSDFHRAVTEFSGGWLMRIALAKLLLRRPEVLLLDEPTNHLDIESLQWMENFLKEYDGAVILVSHDRKFLDEITNRTFALDHGSLDTYEGNYSYYVKKWQLHQEQLRREYKNQQKRIKEIQEFIDKFRYNSEKASLVQSRIKQLEKMEEIELQDEQDEIAFEFPEPERSGDIVMELEGVDKSYGDVPVLKEVELRINRGDRLAVVGPNGAGKSTLIRILAGIETVDDGKRSPGYNVTPSYYAQHQAEEIDVEKQVIEVMEDTSGTKSETYLRTILGCFLFQGDDVFKKVGVLSGGEKSRLALARMLVRPSNFLIMDEPTNHLDMQSKTILQQALQDYSGTYIIVSHDRDFLDPLVNKVIEVKSHSLKTYPGNISEYLDKKTIDSKYDQITSAATDSSNNQTAKKDNESLSRQEQKRRDAKRRNERHRKIKPYKQKLDPIEEQIEKLEDRKEEIESLMQQSDFYDDSQQVQEISREYDQIKQDLQEAYGQWENIAEKISEIEEQYSKVNYQD